MPTKSVHTNFIFAEMQEILEEAEHFEPKKFLVLVMYVVVMVVALTTLRGGRSWYWWSQSPATFNLSD